MELNIMLPCGLHIWVAYQNENVKEHPNEFWWGVESSTSTVTHARGHDPDKVEAIKKAKEAARNVLLKSLKQIDQL